MPNPGDPYDHNKSLGEGRKFPTAGNTIYYNPGSDAELELQVGEVLGETEEGSNEWKVIDNDGDECVIQWSADDDRWEVQ